MDQMLDDLYDQYLAAVHFFNEYVEDVEPRENIRSMLKLTPYSKKEFAAWWSQVRLDEVLESRWLERFKDPCSAFSRSCQSITELLGRISGQKSAA